MAAALDLLEAKRAETYATLFRGNDNGLALERRVERMQQQLRELYRFAIQQSKGDLTVPEVFELWDKMVSICDFFIDHLRITAGESPQPVCYDELLDLRIACDEKREFHRC